MKVAIHQPQYLPWLGYFDKMDQADVFVFLDTVQYKKNEWQNRNRIKTPTGWQWLTVPVHVHFPQTILETRIDASAPWRRKHLQALQVHYGKAPFFSRSFPLLEELVRDELTSLADLNATVAEGLARVLGMRTRTVRASSWTLREDPTERLVDICRAVGADTYLAGRDGARYMDVTLFAREGITVLYQEYTHPVYPQLYGEFIPQLSVVDLLFNQGNESLATLRTGSRWRSTPPDIQGGPQ